MVTGELRQATANQNILLRMYVLLCNYAACVDGLSDPLLSTCDSTGTNDNVTTNNYTCNAGYFKTSAPEYCQGMDVMGRIMFPWYI
jgi:hypothetical protein